MAFATIQITQGATVGGNGQSVIGLDATTVITLTDAGGAGATTYSWEVESFPAPDGAAPTITSSTTQVATITPPGGGLTDGVYLLRLTRNDPVDGVSSDVKFFAVEDADGLSLPSPGQNRNNSNIGGAVAAQEAGWFGSAVGSSNVFLDAFLRLRRLREGRYIGDVSQVAHTLGTSVIDTMTWGIDAPLQEITLTGAGNFTADLQSTGAQTGSVFRFQLAYSAGAGNFFITDNGGSAILTLTAPPAGNIAYKVQAYFDGTNWALRGVSFQNEALIRNVQNNREHVIVAGVQSTSLNSPQRAGTLQFDASIYPASQQFTFEASFDTTDPANSAVVELYNVSDGVTVGSLLTTPSTTNQTQSVVVTLPSSQKDYEVRVRLTAEDLAQRATLTRALLIATWG